MNFNETILECKTNDILDFCASLTYSGEKDKLTKLKKLSYQQ